MQSVRYRNHRRMLARLQIGIRSPNSVWISSTLRRQLGGQKKKKKKNSDDLIAPGVWQSSCDVAFFLLFRVNRRDSNLPHDPGHSPRALTHLSSIHICIATRPLEGEAPASGFARLGMSLALHPESRTPCRASNLPFPLWRLQRPRPLGHTVVHHRTIGGRARIRPPLAQI